MTSIQVLLGQRLQTRMALQALQMRREGRQVRFCSLIPFSVEYYDMLLCFEHWRFGCAQKLLYLTEKVCQVSTRNACPLPRSTCTERPELAAQIQGCAGGLLVLTVRLP